MILELYPLLKHIEARPAMWTGELSLRSIDNFVSGYHYALFENGLTDKSLSNELFFDWVANKFGYCSSTAGWVNMIVAYTIGFKPKSISWDKFLELPISKEQHIKSVEMFYELLEEFKTEHEKKMKYIPKKSRRDEMII